MKFEEILNCLNDIMATMPVEEKQVLYEEASKIPDNGIIVDIGTCDGASAFIMALANPNSQVWTIDPKVGPNFLTKREKLGLEDRVHFINDTSNNASFDWKKEIDLLFIDGVHSTQGILDDINNWAKYVKNCSIVLLHDYLWYGDNVKNAMELANVKLSLVDVPFGLYDGKPVGIARTKRI
ncbi:class I SAM-dependent methyltransferase [Candidatus Dojkabacteria bacterium]|jgi:predicted O-methyltransferase YrrM|nr:class I SAM-dependent methyltransferase [Candidatus Dojkabacteria bacterium]